MRDRTLYLESQRLAHAPAGWLLLALLVAAWMAVALLAPIQSIPFALALMAYAWVFFFVPLARLEVGEESLRVRYSRRRVLEVPYGQVVGCDVAVPPWPRRLAAWLLPGGLVARDIHGVAALGFVRLRLLGGLGVHVGARRPRDVSRLVRQFAPLLQRPAPKG